MKIYRTEIVVNHCADCPDHCRKYIQEERCAHYQIMHEMVDAIIELKEDEKFPAWCPLSDPGDEK